MASKTLLTLLAVAMLVAMATAYYGDEDDDPFLGAFEDEVDKRDFDLDEDFLDEVEKRSYPRCRHWFTKSLCRCDYKFEKYDERRYNCISRQRGNRHSPFG